MTLHLFECNVSERKWSQEPVTSTFLIEQVPLGAGTFREAYKARQLGRGLAIPPVIWKFPKYPQLCNFGGGPIPPRLSWG